MPEDCSNPKPGVLPGPSDYCVALDKAWAELEKRDPQDVAAFAEVELTAPESSAGTSAPVYLVPLLGETMSVDVGDRVVRQPDGSELISYLSVLVLHYLLGAQPGRVSDEWVTFRELEAGRFYLPAFRSRATDRLEPVLGPRPDALLDAARPLGGERMDFGDAGARIAVMPKAHIGIVVWVGDDELPSSVTMLFGRTAAEIFPTEDLAVAGGLVAGRLIKNLRSM